jgi:hypothetical protein
MIKIFRSDSIFRRPTRTDTPAAKKANSKATLATGNIMSDPLPTSSLAATLPNSQEPDVLRSEPIVEITSIREAESSDVVDAEEPTLIMSEQWFRDIWHLHMSAER